MMEDELTRLNFLNIGEKGIVKKITSDSSIRRRLLDIGLINGTTIECVLKSPFGDPTAYSIRGAVIAIREEDAKKIYIERL